MGALQSAEYYDELGTKKRQNQQGSNNQHYPRQRHHQQRQQQQQPQQWQQQQWQRQQGQQLRRHISTLQTPELLDYLEKEFVSTVTVIQNMKRENIFDEGGRAYILDVMIEKEEKLSRFNNSMKKGNPEEIRQGPTFNKKVQRLEFALKASKEDYLLLKQENERLEGLMTSSMKLPTTSIKAQSMCEGSRNNNRGNEQVDNLKSVKDLQQRLSICTRELDEEREARRKAISYIEHLKEANKDLQKDKNDLQLRLSKLAGERLTENNPAIADLSDPNRPTKIGEMYSEVYDNEWTDAYEALVDAGYKEIEAIDILRLTLLNVIQFCSKKSDSLLKKTEEAVNILFEEYTASEEKGDMRHLTMPRNLSEQWGKMVQRSSFDLDAISLQHKWRPQENSEAGDKRKTKTLVKPNTSGEIIGKQLKIFRKEVAVSMVPLVEKAYISASWSDECIYDLKPFIRKCILLGWMMVVQSPPMALAEFKPNEKFRKEIYKEYTASGSYIDFIVWPALLLEKGGPVVGKGVAQGKKVN